MLVKISEAKDNYQNFDDTTTEEDSEDDNMPCDPVRLPL